MLPFNAVKTCCFSYSPDPTPTTSPVCMSVWASSGTDWLCLAFSNKANHTSGTTGNQNLPKSPNALWVSSPGISAGLWYHGPQCTQTHLQGGQGFTKSFCCSHLCGTGAVCLHVIFGNTFATSVGGNNADWQRNACNSSRSPKLLD